MPNRSRFPYPLLLWWAECVAMLDELTPRNRARVLSHIAQGLRRAQAAAPDEEHAFPRTSGRPLGWDAFQAASREWVVTEQSDKALIIE